MNIFVFTPAFLIFIYSFHKLVKDDYVFIRRNVSSEQMLDILFIVTWISLFFSRFFYYVFNAKVDTKIFLSFFSLNIYDFSLSGLIIGGIMGIYVVGKYKKLPAERVFSSFVTAFVYALPVGYVIYMPFFKEYMLLFYFIHFIAYSFFAYFFFRYIKSKTATFLLFFSVFSLAGSALIQFLTKKSFLTIENFFLSFLILISLFLFFKQK